MNLRERNDRRVAERRNAEANDRLHFLVFGHDEHMEHGCLCVPPCSRDYDALPYPEAAPMPPIDYAGTGIGALYGLPGSEAFYPELAGWNVTAGRVNETPPEEVPVGLLPELAALVDGEES